MSPPGKAGSWQRAKSPMDGGESAAKGRERGGLRAQGCTRTCSRERARAQRRRGTERAPAPGDADAVRVRAETRMLVAVPVWRRRLHLHQATCVEISYTRFS